jgi:hypothetical protein
MKFDFLGPNYKNILEIPPCAKPFSENIFYFIERRIIAQNYKFSNKNDLPYAWRELCTYDIRNFKPNISPIFNFEHVNKVGNSSVLGVKGT